MVSFNTIDWVALCENPRKAQLRWGMVAKVMMKTGATVWSQEMMYKVVSHMVLFYRIESRIVTEVMNKVLEGIHHQFSWRIAGISAWRVGRGDEIDHCRQWICGQLRSTFGGNRLQLWNISRINPFMNCTRCQSRCRIEQVHVLVGPGS